MSGVYMWCNHCGKVVEADFYTDYDIPDANVGGYEKHEVAICPICHHRLNDYADSCAVCSEPIAQGKGLCDCCKDEFDNIATEMAKRKNVLVEAVLDGMAEYLNM